MLPDQFETFGNAMNTGRVLMLLLHLASVFFLFQIARKLSGGLLAPVIATFFFNFSPLAIYYERMVLLDNIMVFWVLLSVYLLCCAGIPVIHRDVVGAGLRDIGGKQGECDILRAYHLLPPGPPD